MKIFTKVIVYRVYSSNGDGTSLPSFRDWVISWHGEEYWRMQIQEMFESYVHDIFRKCRLQYEGKNSLREL